MRMLLLGVMVGVLGIATPAGASAPNGAQATAQNSEKPPKERKICRTTRASGSNLTRTTCKTRAEWAAAQADEFDADGEVIVPGNRTATGRNINVGGQNKVGGPG